MKDYIDRDWSAIHNIIRADLAHWSRYGGLTAKEERSNRVCDDFPGRSAGNIRKPANKCS